MSTGLRFSGTWGLFVFQRANRGQMKDAPRDEARLCPAVRGSSRGLFEKNPRLAANSREPDTPGRIAQLCALAVLLAVLSGCAPRGKRTRTIVTGKIEPRQIHYVTTVEHTEDEPSGWRATCIHINIQRKNTGESFLCKFGVEVPMKNNKGPISLPLAQRITAERTHEAARSVFGAATPESPLGMLCQTLKTTLKPLLNASIRGSRVNTECHKKTIPVQFGEFAP